MFLFSPSLYLPFFLSTLHSRFLSSYFPSSFLFVFLPSYDFNTQFREFFFSPIPSVSLFSYLLSTTIAFNPIFLFYPSSIFLPSYDLCTSNSIFFFSLSVSLHSYLVSSAITFHPSVFLLSYIFFLLLKHLQFQRSPSFYLSSFHCLTSIFLTSYDLYIVNSSILSLFFPSLLYPLYLVLLTT